MFSSLLLVVLAGLLGPLLAAGRRPRVPVLVGELAGGAILGRTGFHLVDPSGQPLVAFSTLGFAMLMLQAGTEVDLASPQLRRGARRGLAAFVLTLVLSIPAGLAIGSAIGSRHALLFVVLLAGGSAAVAFPTIVEQRLTDSAAVTMVIAWITLADAVTALVMPLTIVGAAKIPAALFGDLLIVLATVAIIVGGRRLLRSSIADEAERESKQRRWALRLRLSVLMLLALGTISERTGASLLIAGFAAGIVLREFRQPHRLQLELTGLASGFFVPVFFVLLGATLDLSGLIHTPAAIGLALAMATAATLVHLVASIVAGRQARLASGLLASAQLGLPAAAAALGLVSGALTPPIAAALVAGGLLTLIPATAGAILLRRGEVATPDRPV
ncbi:MAG TPA: cation:proton antiporter [Candidatus Acidoferrum sp.]|nr:cation:proton antiporter [Candidatus Acidoferrum sp.]